MEDDSIEGSYYVPKIELIEPRKLEPFEEEIIRLYEKGLPLHIIGDRVHKNRKTIGKILDRNNIKSRKELRKETHLNILELYKKGLTYKEIGNELGIGYGAVHSTIKRYGKSDRITSKDQLNVWTKMIKKLYNEGFQVKDIAKTINVPQTTVDGILTRNNLRNKRFKKSIQIYSLIPKISLLRSKNYSNKQIAKKLNISYFVLNSLICRYKIFK